MYLKKILAFLIIYLFINFISFSQVVNDAQLLKSENWIYDALEILNLENRTTVFLDNKPLSVGELKFYFSQIDFETLSDSGKNLYQQVEEYLFTTKYLWKNWKSQNKNKDSATRLSIGLNLNPEFYGRTNKSIPSTIEYFYKDWPLNVPLIFGISNYVALQLDCFLGKNFESSVSPTSFTNIPLSDFEREYEYPKFTYGNIGSNFGDWGLSATIGKEGFSIGDTKLGSVIYNSTFETDAYSVFSVYSPNFKYNLIFSQVDYKKFLYLHNFNLKLFPNLKISFTEGCLRNGGFELRFLNPTMILHSFYSASTYSRDSNSSYDLGNHYCSYMGITIDFTPIKNLRLYALWAQTELQTKDELKYFSGKLLPDGFGLQIGADFLIPQKNQRFYLLNIESLYTSPFLYLKQSPEWSMVRIRNDKKHSKDVISWLGTPFGPDSFALTCSLIYQQPQKWTIGVGNLFIMKGEIDKHTLLETSPATDENNGQLYPSYYPSVAYELGLYNSKEEAISIAQKKGLTGIIQYRNDFSLFGEYYLLSNLKVSLEGTYSLIFNGNHIKGNFQQGFEVKFSCIYKVF